MKRLWNFPIFQIVSVLKRNDEISSFSRKSIKRNTRGHISNFSNKSNYFTPHYPIGHWENFKLHMCPPIGNHTSNIQHTMLDEPICDIRYPHIFIFKSLPLLLLLHANCCFLPSVCTFVNFNNTTQNTATKTIITPSI